MTATAAATAPAPPKPLSVIPRDRLAEKEVDTGVVMRLTLPGDATLEEGEQNLFQFSEVGELLALGQWVEVSNDSNSFWALMRVAAIHGSRSTGCRGLRLDNIVPPRHFDQKFEAPVATGNWYARWLGPHKKWAVISPSGSIFKHGLRDEAEAQSHVFGRMSSSRPL